MLRQKIKMKTQYARQELVKRTQDFILPINTRSPEQLSAAREYINSASAKVEDFRKIATRVVLGALGLYILANLLNFLSALAIPVAELSLQLALLSSVAVIGLNLLYLAPERVRLSLEEMKLKLKAEEAAKIISEISSSPTLKQNVTIDSKPLEETVAPASLLKLSNIDDFQVIDSPVANPESDHEEEASQGDSPNSNGSRKSLKI